MKEGVTHIPPVRKTKLSACGWGTSYGPARFPHGTVAVYARASFEEGVWPVLAAGAEPEFPLWRPSLPTQTLLPEAVWASGAVAREAREFGGSRFGNLESSGFVDQQLEVLRSNGNSEGKGEWRKGCSP